MKENKIKDNKYLAKRTKGITLVALVVTVTILLILAGVSITVVFGDNGLINYSKDSASRTNSTIDQTKNKIGDINNELYDFMHPSEQPSTQAPTPTPKPQVSELLGQDAKDENQEVQDKKGQSVVIPAGFTVVDPKDDPTVKYEDPTSPTVDDGIVIQDGIGNQFVWVPVPEINDMVRCQTHLNSTITFDKATKKFICSECGSKEPTLVGKLYDFSGKGGSSRSTPKDSITSAREPDTLSKYDDRQEHKTILGVDSINTFNTQLQNEFNDLVDSVNQYKGFYIGRYETGGLSGTNKTIRPKVRKGEKLEGSVNWYYQYVEIKNIALKNTDPRVQKSVTSSMIWGCQWDATLNWFLKGTYEEKGYVTDGTGKGNYGRSVQPTGYYQVKNIYDMAGNVIDYTLEAYDTESRIARGGDIGDDGSYWDVGSRLLLDPHSLWVYCAARSALIVNL